MANQAIGDVVAQVRKIQDEPVLENPSDDNCQPCMPGTSVGSTSGSASDVSLRLGVDVSASVGDVPPDMSLGHHVHADPVSLFDVACDHNGPGLQQLDDRYDPDFYLQNFYEYEQGREEPILKGRLKASVDFWRGIDAGHEVLSVITEGYKLPFIEIPPTACFKNNKSAINHSDFVLEAIEDLIAKNLVIN